MVDVWEHGFLGVDISRLMIALAIVVGFLIIRRLFTRSVLRRLQNWSNKDRFPARYRIFEALDGPVRFIPVVLGLFIAAEYLALTGIAQVIATKALRSLVVFSIFWGFVNAIGPLSFVFRRLEGVLTRAMVNWLVKFIKVALVFIGAATILEIWGIQVGPIIAGLGLFGVAVALGAQDLFKNLIAGLLVLAEKRLLIGDWIRVEGVVHGTVEQIGFRSTLIRRFDRAPVFVPNSQLSDNAVTKSSRMTHRRIYWMIGG